MPDVNYITMAWPSLPCINCVRGVWWNVRLGVLDSETRISGAISSQQFARNQFGVCTELLWVHGVVSEAFCLHQSTRASSSSGVSF